MDRLMLRCSPSLDNRIDAAEMEHDRRLEEAYSTDGALHTPIRCTPGDQDPPGPPSNAGGEKSDA
jgi:hypothetical protein